MNDQHRKVLNTDKSGGKNRIRYQSQRKRSRSATADVYRSYKRRTGLVTSAAVREERVHHPEAAVKTSNRKKNDEKTDTTDAGQQSTPAGPFLSVDSDSDDPSSSSSTFASELDIALDRNASEIFGKFHREMWYLVRSLPEILHNSRKIVDLLMDYLLSPASTPGEKSTTLDNENSSRTSTSKRKKYVVNQATTDILHLLAVLAKDLRHEIHPFLHSKILPRILYDMLSPPIEPNTQPVPLDVTLVEAAFRTLSYVFRYDAEPLLAETTAEQQQHQPCLEPLRRYYGVTLAHRREVVRRLAAESWAPLIRKLPSDAAKKRHCRRVLRALAQQAASTTEQQRLRADAVDGIAQLFLEIARGAAGRWHSKGGHVMVKCVLEGVLHDGKSNNEGRDLVFAVARTFLERLCRHLREENVVPVLLTVIQAAVKCAEAASSGPSSTSLQYALQLVEQISAHRNGVLLQQRGDVLDRIEGLLKLCLEKERFLASTAKCQRLILRLYCSTWKLVPEAADFAGRMTEAIVSVLLVETGGGTESKSIVACTIVRDLLPHLPAAIAMGTIGKAVLSKAADIASDSPSIAVTIVHAMATVKVGGAAAASDDVGDNDESDDVFFIEHASACALQDAQMDRLLQACLIDVDASMSSKTDED